MIQTAFEIISNTDSSQAGPEREEGSPRRQTSAGTVQLTVSQQVPFLKKQKNKNVLSGA